MSIRAILLDFYGTVVEEDKAPVVLVCNEIAKASPKKANPQEMWLYWWKTFQELFRDSYGENFKHEKYWGQEAMKMAIDFFDSKADKDELTQLLFKYWDEYWGKPAIFPESKAVISKISELKIPICILSNIDNAVLESAFEHNQMSFDMIVTSEDCRSYKPRPEMFEKALSMLNVSNNDALHVGDSLFSDVNGAKRIGIPVLWINRKGRSVPVGNEQPDYISKDLNGILDILM